LCEELDRVLDQFPKYHMNILFGDFNAKVRRVATFKLTIRNESLHKTSSDSGIRVVSFAMSKNLVVKCTVKSTVFPHHKIYK
jgi:hypothetical protein